MLNIYVASDGSGLNSIATAPQGFSVATFDKRVGQSENSQ
jgi:hypothetical protein